MHHTLHKGQHTNTNNTPVFEQFYAYKHGLWKRLNQLTVDPRAKSKRGIKHKNIEA